LIFYQLLSLEILLIPNIIGSTIGIDGLAVSNSVFELIAADFIVGILRKLNGEEAGMSHR
jgi:hypothetical protein